MAKIPLLPHELVLEIISKLTSIDDLKNCMEISKEIHDLMFKTPEIMRNILINVDIAEDDSEDTVEILKFLEANATSIRCLRMTIYATNACLKLRSILSDMRNLEEVTMKLYSYASDRDANYKVDENLIINLPKLKSLETDLESFLLLMPNVKNNKNLVNCTISYGNNRNMSNEHCENFVKFLSQQKVLKKLNLKFDDNCPVDFPHRDISEDLKFKLTTLSISRIKNTVNPMLDSFLKIQGKYLKNLILENCPNDDFLEILFENFYNLKNLKLFIQKNNSIFSEKCPHWELRSLMYFEDLSNSFMGDKINLFKLVERFPNIEHLKCGDLLSCDQIFDKITILDLNYSNFTNLCHIKLPNLRVFTVKTTTVILEKNFESFLKNAPKIEKIFMDFQFGGRLQVESFNFMIKLNDLENLETFHIDFLRIKPTEYEWKKCRINFMTKIVKISSDLDPIFERFLEFNFKSFKFVIFSFKDCQLGYLK
ncbi:unnamed protein product [Chironomus riparius]|uniref:F-box domain-containing protein n=1 Tax=Chironomus riparius TaxID=315576 RepID=A0A9N9S8V5_9DIPT|nr:unnamed protein product [Chironomus riparius]